MTALCEAFLWGRVGLKKCGLLAWYRILNAALNNLKKNKPQKGCMTNSCSPWVGLRAGLGKDLLKAAAAV